MYLLRVSPAVTKSCNGPWPAQAHSDLRKQRGATEKQLYVNSQLTEQLQSAEAGLKAQEIELRKQLKEIEALKKAAIKAADEARDRPS